MRRSVSIQGICVMMMMCISVRTVVSAITYKGLQESVLGTSPLPSKKLASNQKKRKRCLSEERAAKKQQLQGSSQAHFDADYVHLLDQYGATLLHQAVEYGHTKVVKMLLKAGVNKDTVDKNGDTPLHKAVFNNHGGIVALLLLENGIKTEMVNKCGFTPLHIAAQKGYWEITMMLLAAGARTDIVDKYGFTPFHWAASNGHRLVVAALLTVSDKVNVYG